LTTTYPLPGGSGTARPLTYRAAGVDIAAGEEAVRLIKPLVARASRPEVIGGIGGFAGLFAMPAGYQEPVLAASADGVGTKLAVAVQAKRLSTVGIDLVAMCVDDLACVGAEPLFLLDYQLWGKLDPTEVVSVVEGISEGCRRAGCAILGGELAEHPGQLPEGELDLAGFAVGVVERHQLLGPGGAHPAQEGDVLIGLHSTGLRSNGFSLVRAALLHRAGRDLDEEAWAGAGHTLADELLKPSLIYAPAVTELARSVEVHGVAHITGGGLPANVPRALPPGLDAILRLGSWPVPRIFREVQQAAGIGEVEMARTFNLGLGMVVIVTPEQAATALQLAGGLGYEASVVGDVIAGSGRCVLVPASREG
jgi:phosphoribosylformylglycinamidine cyclo-ligase